MNLLTLLSLFLTLPFLSNSHKIRPYRVHFKRFDILDHLPLPANFSYDEPLEKYFRQRVDHFDSANRKWFKQRYWVVTDYEYRSVPSSPMFLILGGETAADDSLLYSTQMRKYADEFNGRVFILEHRYYGKSWPVNKTDTPDFRYLTSGQAIEDAANFIRAMNVKHNKTSRKWISLGCSYSGNLSAWLRLKHPKLVSGALASSAPVKAVLKFSEYYEHVVNQLGVACTTSIRHVFNRFKKDMKSNRKRKKLVKKMDIKMLTEDFQHSNDTEEIVSILVLLIGASIQSGDKSRGNVVKKLCKAMKNHDHESRLAYLLRFYKDKQPEGNVEDSCWFYQMCNEFGYFQNIPEEGFFGEPIRVEDYIEDCQTHNGKRFNRKYIRSRIDKTNRKYGGKQFNGSNVLFVNGELDPWSPLMPYDHYGRDFETHLIQEHGHCADWETGEVRGAIEATIQFIRRIIDG